jgi:hypothetical protein
MDSSYRRVAIEQPRRFIPEQITSFYGSVRQFTRVAVPSPVLPRGVQAARRLTDQADSEALLASPFLARHRGDELAEAYTHADDVVGHFNFRTATKAALKLNSNARQFVVLEAKMSSKLSAGTRRVSTYDQAARTVDCMAKTSRITLSNLDSIGFYLIAPEEQLRRGVFQRQMTHDAINEKVRLRMKQYDMDKVKTRQLEDWYERAYLPLIQRIDLGCWSWEATVDRIIKANQNSGEQAFNWWLPVDNSIHCAPNRPSSF